MAVTAITLTVNDAYVVPAVVLLASLEGKLAAPVEIVIRDTGLGVESHRLLTAQARMIECPLRFVPCDSRRFSGSRLLAHHQTSDTFAHLLSFEEVVDQHRFILALDCDLLIRQSLTPLMECLPAEGTLLSAVPQHFIPTIWADEAGGAQSLGLSPSDNFFMGGVMVIDVERWRNADLSDRVLTLFDHEPSRWMSDLSLLNAAVERRWSPLDYRWNVWTEPTAGPFRFVRVSGPTDRSIVAASRVSIAHFGGYFKPWLANYPINAWRFEYLQAARRSVIPARLLPKVSLSRELLRVAARIRTRAR